MGGSSKQTTTQSQSSQTNPWQPTMGALNNIIGQINGQMGNVAPTGNEMQAFDALRANATGTPSYAPQVGALANDLFTGGPDRSGYVTDAYNQYRAAAQPYLSQDYLNPYNNPAFSTYMSTVSNDIQNRINAQFAGAGRDMSGMNQGAVARGIVEGTAPVFANQYNQNVATQTGLMNNMFNAGTQTGANLSALDQTALGNRMQGANTALGMLPMAQDMNANRMLAAEGMARNLPLSNIANIENLLLPIAGLGGQSEGTSTGTTTMRQNPIQTAVGAGIGALGLFGGMLNPGTSFGGGLFNGFGQGNPWGAQNYLMPTYR